MAVERIIPPGFAEVSMNITRGGDPDPYSITFGIEIDEAPYTPSHLANLVTAFHAEVDQLMWDSERFSSAVARVGQDGEDPLVVEVALDLDGADGAQRLPPNCAVLVKKLTTLGGRRGRGRFYWPSIDEDSVNSVGLLASGTVTAYQNAFDAAFTAMVDTSPDTNVSQVVLLHSQEVPGPAAPVPTPLTGFLVDPLLSTQRRRLRK